MAKQKQPDYFHQGVEAYHKGLPLNANPFYSATIAYAEWQRGFYAAMDGYSETPSDSTEDNDIQS